MKDDAMVWFHVDDDADDDDDDDHDDDHDNDDIKDTFQSFNIQILQCHHIQNQTRFRLPGSFCFLWWGLPCRTHQLADFLLTTRFLSMSIVWAQWHCVTVWQKNKGKYSCQMTRKDRYLDYSTQYFGIFVTFFWNFEFCITLFKMLLQCDIYLKVFFPRLTEKEAAINKWQSTSFKTVFHQFYMLFIVWNGTLSSLF